MKRRKARAQYRWRREGREIWITCKGDLEKCKQMAQQRFGSLAAFITILQILILIWEFWSETMTDEPSVVAQPDEPIDWDPDRD